MATNESDGWESQHEEEEEGDRHPFSPPSLPTTPHAPDVLMMRQMASMALGASLSGTVKESPGREAAEGCAGLGMRDWSPAA
jgi:hypothetical protein